MQAGRPGLDVLEGCARALVRELQLEAQATGLDVHVEGRLKSLYSVHRKMARKGISLAEVFDARALRVVVSDADGQHQARRVFWGCRILRILPRPLCAAAGAVGLICCPGSVGPG